MVEISRSCVPSSSALKVSSGGAGRRRRRRVALGQIAAERRAALLQVGDLLAIGGRLAERKPGDLLIGDRDVEAIAHRLEILFAELFLLVRDVESLGGLAEPEALDRLGKDDRGRTFVGDGRCVGCIHLHRIMTAAVQAPDLIVGHVGDHFLELRILAEKMLAGIGAAFRFEVLILPVHAFLHQALEQSLVIALEQRVPARSPQHLDDVPTGAEKRGLELLDDLAVAAHRTVETLQVAVDDEDEVVELLAHRHGERAHRLGLVHLAVAEKRPDLAVGCRHDPAILEIAHEPRLEYGHHGTKTHGHRGVLPEIGHEPGMRIRGQSAAAHLLAKALQLRLIEPPLEIGAGIDARARVALHVDHVAGMRGAARAPEVVESNLIERRGGGVARDMTAVLRARMIRLHHHGERIPAHVGLVAPLERAIARIIGLLRPRYGVEVGRVRLERQIGAGAAGEIDQFLEQEVRPLRPLGTHDGLHRLEPLLGFCRVDVFEG